MIDEFSARLPALLLAFFLATTGAGAAEYKVTDSGAALAEFPAIQWMDPHRVIFLGVSGEHCKRDTKPDSYRKPLPRITVFDTRTGQLSWHGGVGVSRLCYADGNVNYARQIVDDGGLCSSDKWEFLRGRFGEETVQPEAPIGENCRPEPEGAAEARKVWVKETLAREKEKNDQKLRMVRMREEHGWLAIRDGGVSAAPSRPNYPIAIYPPGKENKPIPIDKTLFEPWLAKGYEVEFLRYEAFRNAYLLAIDDRGGAFSGHHNGALWWLFPDGSVASLTTYGRHGLWKYARSHHMYPTRNGIVVYIADSSAKSDAAGFYRLNLPAELAAVDKGWIGPRGVLSPDGCKLAYGIDSRGLWEKNPKVYSLHLIDVCNVGTP